MRTSVAWLLHAADVLDAIRELIQRKATACRWPFEGVEQRRGVDDRLLCDRRGEELKHARIHRRQQVRRAAVVPPG